MIDRSKIIVHLPLLKQQVLTWSIQKKQEDVLDLLFSGLVIVAE